MQNNNICPICRRVIRNRIKLIYEFSNRNTRVITDSLDNSCPDSKTAQSSSITTTSDLFRENAKLLKEKQILKDEKVECENKLSELNQKLVFYADQFAEVNVSVLKFTT